MFEQLDFQPAAPPPGPSPTSTETVSTGSARQPLRVLVVDDERLIATTVAAILNQHGFQATAAFSGQEALEAARTLDPDVLLSDVLMPRMSGVELGVRVRNELPHTRVLLFSGQAATMELLRKAQQDGYSFELFPKPIHPEELVARLKSLSGDGRP